jgi:hypothetical protein
MNRLLCRIVVSAVGAAALFGFAGVSAGAAQIGASEVPRLATVSIAFPSTNQPDLRFADNAQESTTYGDSVADIRRQANKYAKEMQARGYNTQVQPLAVDKHGDGRGDITVEVSEKGYPKVEHGKLVKKKVAYIRHFVTKNRV